METFGVGLPRFLTQQDINFGHELFDKFWHSMESTSRSYARSCLARSQHVDGFRILSELVSGFREIASIQDELSLLPRRQAWFPHFRPAQYAENFRLLTRNFLSSSHPPLKRHLVVSPSYIYLCEERTWNEERNRSLNRCATKLWLEFGNFISENYVDS